MKNKQTLLAAAFLMATSAIGPGFLTQTTYLSQELGYSFGFGILLSIIIDLVVQKNIWVFLGLTGLRASAFGQKILPPLGIVLGYTVVFGGLVFNIGNIAGAGMGLEAVLNVDIKLGGIISVIICIILFSNKRALNYLDFSVKIMGLLMLVMIFLLVFKAKLSFGALLRGFVWPDIVNVKAIMTIVGGTVGGYISFAGIHRLIESNIVGLENKTAIKNTANRGIIITGICRLLLFIGTLGVLNQGIKLDSSNPTASVFLFSLGSTGKIIFGIIIYFASITSILGATFTSISFLEDLHPGLKKHKKLSYAVFMSLSLIIFILAGKPTGLLLFAGYVNSFVLPLIILLILIAIKNKVFDKVESSAINTFLLFSIFVLISLFSVLSLMGLK